MLCLPNDDRRSGRDASLLPVAIATASRGLFAPGPYKTAEVQLTPDQNSAEIADQCPAVAALLYGS